MGGKKGIVGGVVGGPMGFFLGSQMDAQEAAARAAGGAAEAQRKMANRQAAELRQMTEGVTVQGIANFDKAIAAQERNLARQEQMVAQIDPTVIEASQQALRLLRGESSSTLAPLRQQRDMQRQKLVNSLRAQFGPGAESSSAGLRALTQFDSETGSLFSGAQQQSLANLGNIFGQFNAGRPDMLREASGLGALGAEKAGLRYKQAGVLQGANMAALQSAGSQYTGDILKQQGRAQLYGNLFNAGVSLATMGLSSGLGGAASGGGGGGGGGMATTQPIGGNTNPFGMSAGYGQF